MQQLSNIHPVSCVHLTKDMLDAIMSDPDNNSNDILLISPMGNLFVLGEIDKIEIFEIDKDTVEYMVADQGETTRNITFVDGNSGYGILIGDSGYLRHTTGIEPPAAEDRKEWGDWHRAEIGLNTPTRH